MVQLLHNPSIIEHAAKTQEMDYTLLMHVCQAVADLVHNVADCGLGEEFGAMLDHFIEVLLHVFKHKVEFVVLPADLNQSNYVCMLQFQQGL